MKRYTWLLIISLLLTVTIPLNAQEDDDGYTIALERIQDALDTNAEHLDLARLNLSVLPPEISQLSNLLLLSVRGNPLIFPPQDIVEQGSDAILDYLRVRLSIWRAGEEFREIIRTVIWLN